MDFRTTFLVFIAVCLPTGNGLTPIYRATEGGSSVMRDLFSLPKTASVGFNRYLGNAQVEAA